MRVAAFLALVPAAASFGWLSTAPVATLPDLVEETAEAGDAVPVPCAPPPLARRAARDVRVAKPPGAVVELEYELASEPAAPTTDRRLPLRVSVVDAESGLEHREATWSLELEPALVRSGEALDVALESHESQRHSVRADRIRLTEVDGRPAAFSLWSPQSHVVAKDATSLAATWPFARDADAFVVLTAGGDPVPPDWRFTFHATVAGKKFDVVSEPVVGGVRLRGIPFRRAAQWTLDVRAYGQDGRAERRVDGVMPSDPSVAVAVSVDLPTKMNAVGGGRGGVRNLRCGCGCGHRSGCFGIPEKPARVAVTVLRKDGRPASFASVRLVPIHYGSAAFFCGRTDAEGRVAWNLVADGEFSLELREPGLVPTSRSVTVTEGAEHVFELREQAGATIDVYVQDERGDGVPFAELSVKQPSDEWWIDLVDGVQRLDRFVDARGLRVLENVEPGDVEIEATYADRKGRGTVRTTPGGSSRLWITIAHAPPSDAR